MFTPPLAVQKTWNGLNGKLDSEQYRLVAELLAIQRTDAEHWRNVCLTYFQKFSQRPYPDGVTVKSESAP